MIKNIIKSLSNISIQGRANRLEYGLILGIFILLEISIVGMIANDTPNQITIVLNFLGDSLSKLVGGNTIFIIFSILFGYIQVLWLCIIIRRLHDLDKNGRYSILILIPIVNLITLIILLLVKGTQGENRFGKSGYTQNNI